MDFWKRQPENIRRENFNPSPSDVLLIDGMKIFSDFLNSCGYIWRSSYIFSRGNAFDFGKLEHIFETNLKTEPPFNKFMERDVRTMIDFYSGSNEGKYKLSYSVTESKHSSLSDAAMDAARMIELFHKTTNET